MILRGTSLKNGAFTRSLSRAKKSRKSQEKGPNNLYKTRKKRCSKIEQTLELENVSSRAEKSRKSDEKLPQNCSKNGTETHPETDPQTGAPGIIPADRKSKYLDYLVVGFALPKGSPLPPTSCVTPSLLSLLRNFVLGHLVVGFALPKGSPLPPTSCVIPSLLSLLRNFVLGHLVVGFALPLGSPMPPTSCVTPSLNSLLK